MDKRDMGKIKKEEDIEEKKMKDAYCFSLMADKFQRQA